MGHDWYFSTPLEGVKAAGQTHELNLRCKYRDQVFAQATWDVINGEIDSGGNHIVGLLRFSKKFF